MGGEVIKSFLVGLGFEINDSDFKKFNKSIADATLRVTALYASVEAAAGGIAFGITKISESFEDLGYEYKIIAPAINKAIILRQEMLKAYAATGINLTKVVQASVQLNLSITKTKYALEAIYKSVGSRFFELLTKQSDIFRKKLYENMPKIQHVLEKFVSFIFKAFEVLNQLGSRLWSILTRVFDFFVMLDRATDGWSTTILGVVAAWKLLNLSFLATPLGALLAGFVALLALFDDFKTWQEGGQSLFNWAPALSAINAVILALKFMSNLFGTIIDQILYLGQALVRVFTGNFSGALDSVKNALSSVKDFITNPFVGANIQSGPTGGPNGAPASGIGSNVQNSAVNQNVTQQTSISVVGSADANSIGKAVAGEQNRVNFDMTRNMKGSLRSQ